MRAVLHAIVTTYELDDSITAHAELTLYIAHYLFHAREHHPAIYREVIANEELREAFAALDRAFGALVAQIHELEPTVHEVARSRGAPVYQDILAELR